MELKTTIIFVFLVFSTIIYGGYWINFETVDYVEACVEEKERIQDEKISKYLIFTQQEVFENTDNMLFLKFNSSDVYRDLKIGSCYHLKVNHLRIPFLSMYRNILEVK